MKFIKRLVFVLILLVIAFLIYRLIAPNAAKELLRDIKSFSNTTIGTHFSLSGSVMVSTGTETASTGVTLRDTGSLDEFTSDEELLLNDAELPQDTGFVEIIDTGDIAPTTGKVVISGSIPSSSGTVKTPQKKASTPTTSTSTKGLSAQDIRDLKTLFGN